MFFQLCVTGSNLTGACKLVFKIARNEVNDSLFIDSDVPGICKQIFIKPNNYLIIFLYLRTFDRWSWTCLPFR